MVASWTEQAKQFKSPLPVVAGFLLRSRETQAKRAKSHMKEIERLNKHVECQHNSICKLQAQMAEMEAEIARRKIENQQLRKQPPILPEDPPLPHHDFGAKMISLCVNLARRIGLRAVTDVLRMVFDWLGVNAKLPDWTTVRIWMLRVGVAGIMRPIEPADDWIWLADHSNQIGPEKALSIIGLRASNMPPPGQALQHDDVRVLELSPGTSWKREDMKEAYGRVAQQYGAPLALITDGAVELREGAEMCESLQNKTIILGDFKHHAANVLKKIVGNDDRFSEFSTLLGRTRSAIQQTELAHFTPPSPKPKARFMNLKPTLRWAMMMLWQLSHPDSEARQEISDERVNEKLGWLRDFHDDIHGWYACQEVVCASCKFINEQGVFPGATRKLRECLQSVQNKTEPKSTNASRAVIAHLLRFLRQSEATLAEGQRLPMSTEILESSFGLFKQLEGQHSKGGFTSLLAAYACLLHPTTPESIRRDFALVSVKDVQHWVSEKLGKTLASKRQIAYQESRNAA